MDDVLEAGHHLDAAQQVQGVSQLVVDLVRSVLAAATGLDSGVAQEVLLTVRELDSDMEKPSASKGRLLNGALHTTPV